MTRHRDATAMQRGFRHRTPPGLPLLCGAQAHTDAGVPTSGPRRRTVNQPVMLELVRTCDFEGHVTWVVGVGSPNAYTPQVMAAPSRW